MRQFLQRACGVAVLVGCLCGASSARAQNTALTSFTYAGELQENGIVVNGTYDLTFTPFATATDTVALGASFCVDNVVVQDGRFTVKLPITVPADGSLFLSIAVRSDSRLNCSNTTGFTTLSPRQEVTPAPTSVYTMAIREVAPTLRGALRLTDTGALQMYDGATWRVVTSSLSSLPAVFTDSRTFANAGTAQFTVPLGVTTLYFAAWGGSGAGGALGPGVTALPGGCSAATNFASAGSGGAPGRRVVGSLPVTPGERLTIIVGGGGRPTTNGDGTAGESTIIRRGTTDVLVVPGGGGGRRATTTTGMPQNGLAVGSCSSSFGNIVVAGGSAAAAAQLVGGGSLADVGAGDGLGIAGRGPSCFLSGVTNPVQVSCDAKPGVGSGGEDLTGTTPQYPATFTFPGPGPSGTGGSATSLPTAGNSGRVTLFWM